MLKTLLQRFDLFHILSVVTGDEAPSAEEVKYLKQIKSLLAVPVGGDLVWKKALDFVNAKPERSAMALAYLNSGLERAGKSTVEDLSAAKPRVIELLDHFINRDPVPELAAVAQCPQCLYIFGETT